MMKGSPRDPYAAAKIFEAVTLISRSFNEASIEELLAAHDMVHNHFLDVVEAARGTFDNAAEQRVLGSLWAEIEMTIDDRRKLER